MGITRSPDIWQAICDLVSIKQASVGYERRYSVLHQGILAWFHPSQVHHGGEITTGPPTEWIKCLGSTLEQVSELDADHDPPRYCFTVTAIQGSLTGCISLATETSGEREFWLEALRSMATKAGRSPSWSANSESPARRIQAVSEKMWSSFSLKKAGIAPVDEFDDEEEHKCIISLQSGEEGKKRKIFLSAATEEDGQAFVQVVRGKSKEAVSRAKKRHHADASCATRAQYYARKYYHSTAGQAVVAVLISSAFMVDVLEAQSRPEPGSSMWQGFMTFEIIFTVLFGLELLLLFVAHGMLDFFRHFWNLWDLLVVIACVTGLWLQAQAQAADQQAQAADGPRFSFAMLRLFRVFKMVKVFKKLRSLRILINAISQSVMPVLEALLIIILVVSVFSILATQLFGATDFDNFGSFGRSIFTLIQCATGALLTFAGASPLQYGVPAVHLAAMSLISEPPPGRLCKFAP